MICKSSTLGYWSFVVQSIVYTIVYTIYWSSDGVGQSREDILNSQFLTTMMNVYPDICRRYWIKFFTSQWRILIKSNQKPQMLIREHCHSLFSTLHSPFLNFPLSICNYIEKYNRNGQELFLCEMQIEHWIQNLWSNLLWIHWQYDNLCIVTILEYLFSNKQMTRKNMKSCDEKIID